MINAVVTRNRELLSRSGSYMRAADGVARGGDPPRHSVFFLREKRDVSGSDFFGAYYGVKKSSLTPLSKGLDIHL